MTLPLITAAFTSYNARDTIEAALRSAIDQDWPNLEIVVVDDASSDDTVAIIEAFIARHASPSKPMRLIRQQHNAGVAATRNHLIAEASGEFIAFFDDDDVSAPDRILLQHRRIISYEAAAGARLVACYAAREQVFPNGHMHYEPTMGTEDEGVVPSGLAVADRILIGRISAGVIGSCATCSVMARKEVYQSVGGFNPSLRRGEDTDFNIRLALAGGAFVGVGAPLVTQTMTRGAEKELSAELAGDASLVNMHASYLRSIGWLGFCMHWQKLRQAYLARHQLSFVAALLVVVLRYPMKTLKKLYWSLPARETRKEFRRWHADAHSEIKNAE